jgi:hypothetical protein
MTISASGFDTKIYIRASRTFPAGFLVSELADDADLLDIPPVQIAEGSMGGNGDAVKWSRGNLIKLTINVIPNSESDRNLSVLANANRVGKNKTSADDEITMTVINSQSGKSTTYINGFLTDAPFGDSVASNTKIKTKAYSFAFENIAATLF